MSKNTVKMHLLVSGRVRGYHQGIIPRVNTALEKAVTMQSTDESMRLR